MKQQAKSRNVKSKPIPQAFEVEQKVLGILMTSDLAVFKVNQSIFIDYFFDGSHRIIFSAISDLVQSNKPVDILTVTEQLRVNDNLESIGGPYYITQLSKEGPADSKLDSYINILIEKARMRGLIAIANEINDFVYEKDFDQQALFNRVYKDIMQLQQFSKKDDIVPFNEILPEAWDKIVSISNGENSDYCIPSGFDALDDIIGGFQKSSLIVIASRPAIGKTSFLISLIQKISVRSKIPAAIFSLEMSRIQLTNRLMIMVSGVEDQKVLQGKMEPCECGQLDYQVGAQLKECPLYILDSPQLSIVEIRNIAYRLVREKGVKIIFIDYLQLIRGTEFGNNSRYIEVTNIIQNLKMLSKELDIPIIVTSQLNRSVEERNGVDGNRPLLRDLRDSGAIEECSDVICFIHRPDYQRHNEKKKESYEDAEFIVAKNRMGNRGEFILKFNRTIMKFVDDDYVYGFMLPPSDRL